MLSELIIREGIIFFEEEVEFHSKLAVKLCSGQTIYKFHDFDWNALCRRWERKDELKIPWPNTASLDLEVYSLQKSSVPVVLGEGSINMAMVAPYLHKEIKIALVYDGIYVGNLFCSISNCEQETNQLTNTFLYIHKIDIILLDDVADAFSIRVLKNCEQVYEKEFHIHHKAKSIFPNIKIPVKMSDAFTVEIGHETCGIKDVKFLTDSIRRGKTTCYEVWLRNKLKNKVGDLKIQYFLENLYLENERQIFARNGIYYQKLSKPITELNEQEKDKVRRSVIIRQIEEADKRILKINSSLKKFTKSVEISDCTSTSNKLSNYQRGSTVKQNRPLLQKSSTRNRAKIGAKTYL